MTFSVTNGGYAFLIRLDWMFSISLWKDFQLLQILNALSIRHLIKLILYQNDVNLWYVWSVRFWLLIPEMNRSKKSNGIVNLLFYSEFNVTMPII